MSSDASLSARDGCNRSAGARRRERRNMAAILLDELADIKEQNKNLHITVNTLHGQVAQVLQLLALPHHGWPYGGHINPFLAWCSMAPFPSDGSGGNADFQEPVVKTASMEQTSKLPEPECEKSPAKVYPSPLAEHASDSSCGKCLNEFYDVIVHEVAVQTEADSSLQPPPCSRVPSRPKGARRDSPVRSPSRKGHLRQKYKINGKNMVPREKRKMFFLWSRTWSVTWWS